MSSSPEPPFLPLILAGGRATRMGCPKHLLSTPNGKHLYENQIEVIREAFPGITEIYISLAQDSQLDDLLQMACSENGCLLEGNPRVRLKVIFDEERNLSNESAGPASGILAAANLRPNTTWLVVACDFPFLTADALRQLVSHYEQPVTCFRNLKGYCEPLLGLWSPQALEYLADNHKKGVLSPSRVVDKLGGPMLLPTRDPQWTLFNVNSRADWTATMKAFSFGQDNSSI